MKHYTSTFNTKFSFMNFAITIDINFTIKAKNCNAALKALNIWADEKHLSLEEGLASQWWVVDRMDNGDVTICYYKDKEFDNNKEMFEVLAPYVKKGSYINVHGEISDYWQWCFDGNQLIKKTGRLVFD